MFTFSVNTTRTSNTLEFHNNRICDFFQYEGSIECFNDLHQRKLLPLNWVKVINAAIKNYAMGSVPIIVLKLWFGPLFMTHPKFFV